MSRFITSPFLDNPLYLFRVWDGGMSFHGVYRRDTGDDYLAVRTKRRSFRCSLILLRR